MANWKTALAGLLAGLAVAWANYSGPNTWQGYVSALGPVAVGLLAKDFNVTGGTVSSNAVPPTPSEVAAAAPVVKAIEPEGKE